jgi:hypothetical protein
MSELGIVQHWASLYIREIFGFQTRTHYISGLVDSKSEDEFDDNLSLLKETWNKREIEARDTLCPRFYDWFVKYHSSNMKSSMISPNKNFCWYWQK